jgi:hypothetical protein
MEMRKNYNFTRSKLYLPEYGRHIHKMVDSLMLIEDRQERTRQAKAVIAVMGNLNPMLRDTEEFKHKLWDHLFIMSDFQLDVDSPYPQPSRQDLMIKPPKLRYTQSRILFKHYGKYAQNLVRAIAEHSHNSAQFFDVARYMRAKSYEYNNEHPNNESIVRDIRIMADAELDMDLSVITNMRSEYRANAQQRVQKRGKQQAQKHNNGRKVAKTSSKPQQRHHQSK